MTKFARIFFSIVLCSQLFPSFAQEDENELEHDIAVHENQEKIDSLITTLMNEHSSPEKVDTYLELSNEYLVQDHEKSLKYAKEALGVAFEVGDREGILDCHMAIAYIHVGFTLDLQAALSSYEDALEIAKELDKKRDLLAIYRGIGNIYASLTNFDAAEDYMIRALHIAEGLDDDREISALNAYIGSLYEEDGDTTSALDYYAAVVEIEKKTKFHNASNPSLIIIAHYYFLTDDIFNAIKFYRIALKRFQRNLDNRWLSYTHSRLAHLYLSQGNYDKAEAHAINGLSIAEQFKLSKEVTDNYLILVDIAKAQGKHDLAARYQKVYDELIADIREHADLLNSKADDIESDELPAAQADLGSAKQADPFRFLTAAIICLPILLFALLMAVGGRKQHA